MNRNLALYVEERFPLTQEALLALCAYLEKVDWTRRSDWEFAKVMDGEEPVVVHVPPTLNSPSLVEVSEAFADILLLISIDQKRDLAEVIASVRAEQAAQEEQTALLTEDRLRGLLDERGYGYYERITLEKPDRPSECQVYATRGEREARFLGTKHKLLEWKVKDFAESWMYLCLGAKQQEYIAHTASLVAEVILRQAGLSVNALTPFAREMTEDYLETLLHELQEAGKITIHRGVLGQG